jgi:hypothetical protein
MPRHTTETRDSALDRMRNINRGIVVASLVLTAVFAEAAAKAFPGKKTVARTRTARPATPSKPSGTTVTPEAPSQTPEGTSQTPEGTSQTPESGSAESSPAPSEGSSGGGEATAESPVVSGGS